MSAFLRCALRSRTLHVELSRFVLLPMAASNRQSDAPNLVWQFVKGVILTPVVLVSEPAALASQVWTGLLRRNGREQMSKFGAVKSDYRYNFGALKSFRVGLMGNEFLHYFQKMDQQYCHNTVDKIVLETLIDFLDDHGIDTSDLRVNQSTIFNSGVIVQGGDITAQSLAVGAAAKAETSMLGVTAPGRSAGRAGESK